MLTNTDDHDERRREFEVCQGVMAFNALTGGVGNDEPNPLWVLAEKAGWTLEEFISEVTTIADGTVSYAITRALHVCPPCVHPAPVGGS